MSRPLILARAFLVRDFVTDASYKVSLVIESFDVLIAVTAFYYLSTVVGNRRPGGYEVFAFLLVGLAMNNAMSTALTCFAQAVKLDQQTGVIKPLLAAPLPPALIVVMGSLYPVLRSAISAILFLAAGLVFGVAYHVASALAALVVFAAALGAFTALGMLSAAAALVLKRGDPVLWLFAALSWLLSGVFFPVSLLPPVLQHVAALFPMTHALNALRATLLNGATLSDVKHDMAILIGIAAIGLPGGTLLVQAGLLRVKRSGTLGHY